MPVLTVERLAGLATSTFEAYDAAREKQGKAVWTDLTSDVQKYIVLPKLLNERKFTTDGGKNISRVAMVDHANSTKAIGVGDTDEVTISDNLRTYTVPWRMWKSDTGWFTTEEKLNGAGPKQIVDLIKTRMFGMRVGAAAKMEEWFWVLPASDDGLTPFSVRYWVVRNVTGPTVAANREYQINGDQPWSGTNAGGFSHARWKSGNAMYWDFTADDLLRKWWKAYLMSDYTAPAPTQDYGMGRTDNEFFCDTDTLMSLRQLAEQRNDNLGYDIGISRGGGITFGGNPIIRVSYLDYLSAEEKAYQTIFGFDWSKLYYVFQEGMYRQRTGPKTSATQRHGVEVIEDWMGNLVCDGRRQQFMLSRVSPT